MEKITLCKGRHETPTENAIFPNTLNPMNFKGMEEQAKEVLSSYAGKDLLIYVTGLTPALISALNVCRELNISVTLGHYNRETNSYELQEVK